MVARSPLVVSTHELGRRPGAMRTLDAVVPAPDDLGTEVVRVPGGSDLALDLRLEAVMDGVLVTGTARASLSGECVRCLRDIDDELTVDISELYYYPDRKRSLVDEGDEEAEELPTLEGELLDLEPTVRDAVVLALPFQPLCRPDCGGLCPVCGERMDDLEPGHHHEQLDPRWSALGALLEQEGEKRDGER
ncbi:YceD family protein [Georgenia sp. SUBG003]|uniref:YceD family protein n=1 Tax=Georgenia sp. SUBG003 TaxID=1497974 RepID=UPI0004D60310|nr:metal-binding protein [Georgenia sp. SUBG003]